MLCWALCLQDLASQALDVAKGTKGLEEVVDSIKEHEMAILNSLVDGSALGQHMEVGCLLCASMPASRLCMLRASSMPLGGTNLTAGPGRASAARWYQPNCRAVHASARHACSCMHTAS